MRGNCNREVVCWLPRWQVCLSVLLILLVVYNPFSALGGYSGSVSYDELARNRATIGSSELQHFSPVSDPGLHSDFGHSLLRQKKYPDAEQEFLTAVKLKPDFGEAYGDLAFAASENHEYGLTLKALDMRAKLLPENPPTLFMRASAYDNLKDFKHAAENYRLFLSTANGKYPDQEWQAKHRLVAIEPKK